MLKKHFLKFFTLGRLLYVKECNWEEKAHEVEHKIKTIILDHLQVLSKMFGKCFPESLHQDLKNKI